MTDTASLRDQARQIWLAAVAAVQPHTLIQTALADPALPLVQAVRQARRILVVGGGKAGIGMAQAVEEELADHLERIEGIVNVPGTPDKQPDYPPRLQKIVLHVGRPAAWNQPTEAGVEGVQRILSLVQQAGPEDVVLCLLSGGGSALLPAPVPGVTLADKQAVTKLLHQCGATINEMNTVRKHLSALKGGRLAQQFHGKALFSLIISDVIGDPLDVIASGPTAPDPTTFADAWQVLARYDLLEKVSPAVRRHLERGQRGEIADTPKALPGNIHNLILGNNSKALTAAQHKAEELGFRVLNLGSYLEGETRETALALAGILRSILHDARPVSAPVCVLCGGETTVTVTGDHGKGGRNQELILAMLHKLGAEIMPHLVLLSGGTDGEDGPTDAAGAMAHAGTLARARSQHWNISDYLIRHDAYHFFEQTGDLFQTGPTGTNVMDVQVFLVGER